MTYRIPARAALTIALWTGTALPATACTGQVADAAVALTYAPYAATPVNRRFGIEVAAGCDWRLAIVPRDPARQDVNGVLDYDITGPGGDTVLLQRGESKSNGRTGLRGTEGIIGAALRIDLPGGQEPPPGTHLETLTIGLYEAATGDLLDEGVLTVRVGVAQQLEISLSGADILASTAFPDRAILHKIVDFGELEEGERRALTVLVRGNIGHRIRFRSANGSRMALRDAGSTDGADRGAGVGYVARFDGAALDLRGEVRSGVYRPTSRAGMAIPLDFTIGSVARALAGTYGDVLEITVEPSF